ncbi:hypothetical protein [Butyrivibrio sp. INlla21]|uniref:hypothetical protein n=1 Tax=Butyrivibrio sp. INlla21 TaxID=1520811 RepID=UPI0008DEC185|nr:hypothetical protein [Butyrivibrio sp. INlla21]SFU57311.1 hypothetical protein SAMN02910342_00938 [Butyrivibrio sp. INlla21]
MAKHEYVDIERVLDEIRCMDNDGCITRSTNHICEDIQTISTFTEQEIVKPYLDKLKSEILKATWDNYYMPVNKLSADEIFEIIDNLLTE